MENDQIEACTPSFLTTAWWGIRRLFRRRQRSHLVFHAQTELSAAGLFDKDSDYDGMLGDAVMELIKTFSKQGHSGFSAAMVADLFNKLARYQPIVPLTGNDDEWNEIGDDLFQNRRCSSVFKGEDGSYDIDAHVYREPDGCRYMPTGRVYIRFPYTPSVTIIDVDEKGDPIE